VAVYIALVNSLSVMKNIVAALALVLLTACTVVAQNNGNGLGNAGGNANWPTWVQAWVQNGGQVPHPLALRVVREARQWGQQNFGLNLGQMIQKYMIGELTVELVATSPPSLTFRVSYGGSIAIVQLEDF
jgi:hypothetical protein